MGKANQITDAVFNDIVEDKAYYKFLELDGTKETPQLTKCKELYHQLVTKNVNDLEMMSKLEEVIIQIRCRNVAKKDIKLSQVSRIYLYARAPFFKTGKKGKDIRVVLRQLTSEKENIESLYDDKKLMTTAREKLEFAMDREIMKNLEIIREHHKKLLEHCETDK